MRAPFQVLVIPFQWTITGLKFAIFQRRDGNYWQFIAGGGEDNETPLQAARRETKEEIGVVAEKFIPLDSMTTVPRIYFNNTKHWETDIYVIPEHCFAIEINKRKLYLSNEHIEFRWVKYQEAYDLIKWDSNRNALWELNERLKLKK
ncbi:MAG: NUDIX pyrophosphatase [Candidatus Thorarchaeota archaeon]